MCINLTNGYDSTPLHVSAGFGNEETTKNLVERGSPLDTADNDGHTPLLLVVKQDKLDVFHCVTEMGSDTKIRDVNRNTALHIGAFSVSVEIIKALVDKRMSVKAINTYGRTALHVSAKCGNLEAT